MKQVLRLWPVAGKLAVDQRRAGTRRYGGFTKQQTELAMRRPQLTVPPPAEPPLEPAVEQRIVTRPDGFHWLSADGRREVGPFGSYEEAELDMRADEHSEVEPDQTLAEAEGEIGIADWIDPETGEPAEEVRPRLEDH